ncbi:peptidoglycan DD-metalloendopeptidase family protein, partial [Sphingomonas sp.]|uniref:murein hydrolase activator EnvC family protein n=1 Tax=Sphingomonas sp. TaxID=28214 RepID=UPI001D9BB9A4
AAAAGDEARRAAAREAELAARVEAAQADRIAAEARIALIRRQLDTQRQALARQQGPIVRLVAALQSLARRPAAISLVQPGKVSDLVHVRAVLASVAPGVRAQTNQLRTQLARTRRLEAGAMLAVSALADSRDALDRQRLALARLEAEHRQKSRTLGRDALVESDRAMALGERARDLVEAMSQASSAADTEAVLEGLPGPLPRPARPGTDAGTGAVIGTPYRLPVAGALVTGLGEVSDAGVRSRGLSFRVAGGAAVVAPAAGRVLFAGPFRSYGVVVILDHGNGWSSLISGLASATTRPGDDVAQGAGIGRAGTGDDARVTVELRRRDRPIDLTRLLPG